MSEKRYRVSADIGGTFTDLVFYDQITGVYKAGKTLTTPKNLSDAVMNGIGSEIKDFNEIDFRLWITCNASKTSAIIDRIINNSREFCKILNAAPVFLI